MEKISYSSPGPLSPWPPPSVSGGRAGGGSCLHSGWHDAMLYWSQRWGWQWWGEAREEAAAVLPSLRETKAVHIWPKLANTFSNEKTWPRSQFAVLQCEKIGISSIFFFFPNNAFNSHRAPEVLDVMSYSVEMWPWRGCSVVRSV